MFHITRYGRVLTTKNQGILILLDNRIAIIAGIINGIARLHRDMIQVFTTNYNISVDAGNTSWNGDGIERRATESPILNCFER